MIRPSFLPGVSLVEIEGPILIFYTFQDLCECHFLRIPNCPEEDFDLTEDFIGGSVLGISPGDIFQDTEGDRFRDCKRLLMAEARYGLICVPFNRFSL